MTKPGLSPLTDWADQLRQRETIHLAYRAGQLTKAQRDTMLAQIKSHNTTPTLPAKSTQATFL